MSSAHQPKDANYHGHPNYFLVWATLMSIFFVSLAIGELGNRRFAISAIFSLAVVKALLVLGNFMHLRWEPKLLSAIIGAGFLCLAILYFGVMPDIVWVPVHIAK